MLAHGPKVSAMSFAQWHEASPLALQNRASEPSVRLATCHRTLARLLELANLANTGKVMIVVLGDEEEEVGQAHALSESGVDRRVRCLLRCRSSQLLDEPTPRRPKAGHQLL